MHGAARGNAAGGLGKPFDWHLLENLNYSSRQCFRVPRRRKRRASDGITRAPASMSPPAARAPTV
jgi:hypothetical protein